MVQYLVNGPLAQAWTFMLLEGERLARRQASLSRCLEYVAEEDGQEWMMIALGANVNSHIPSFEYAVIPLLVL